MAIVDHLFIFLLFVVQPIYGAISFRRYIARVNAGQAADRVKLYRQTIIMQWIALAVLAVVWYLYGRPLANVGFTTPSGTGFWIGLGVVTLVIAYLLYAWRESKHEKDGKLLAQLESLGDLIHFLPQTKRDLNYFVAASITAGTVEEIIYRGFVLWYLSFLMPLWAAILLSSIIFGCGHGYQGISGGIKTGLVGLAFALLYVGTGSIWLPIIAHILLDIIQGAAILEAIRKRKSSAAGDIQQSRA
jgi:membrane protease YdiL (CAAX protease family)